MKKIHQIILIVLILLTTISCDQISKIIARENLSVKNISLLANAVRLKYIENDGAFLGLGSEWPSPLKILLFSVLPIGVLIYLFIYLMKSKKMNTYSVVGLSLITGGGIGNLIDRLLNNGRVSDFMNIGIGTVRTGIFNFADVFIMCGFGLLVYTVYVKNKENQY
jgi:signal peptidase II